MKNAKEIMFIILVFMYLIVGAVVLIWSFETGVNKTSVLALEILTVTGMVVAILWMLDRRKNRKD